MITFLNTVPTYRELIQLKENFSRRNVGMVGSKNAKDELVSLLKEDIDSSKISLAKVKEIDGNTIYVCYPVDDSTELNELKSERFENWLFVSSNDEEPTISKVKASIEKLKATADFDETISYKEVFTRIGSSNGKIYLCLHNEAHKVIEIDATGWREIDEKDAPVLFIQKFASPLPTPQKGTSLQDLREFINVNDDDFRLVLGWILATLNPMVKSPILWLNGDKGRGKTMLTKFLKGLIDPDFAGAIAPSRTQRDMTAACSSSYIIGFDNVSRFSQAWSDRLCRIVTGAGTVSRQLRSDNNAVAINSQNALIINSINFTPPADDLEERCFCVKLQKLDKTSRKTEEELNALFEQKRPMILGALLDAVSAALGISNYNKHIDARMLDTCLFIMKAASTGKLPFSDDEFKNTVINKQTEANSYEITSDPLANIIYIMAEEKYNVNKSAKQVLVWDKPTRELLKEVRKRATTGEKKLLPKDPRNFGRRLSEVIREKLNQYGIIAEYKRTSDKRIVRIIYTPNVISGNSNSKTNIEVTSSSAVQEQPNLNMQPTSATNKKLLYTIPTPPEDYPVAQQHREGY